MWRIALLLILFVGCADYGISLPNGYTLNRVNSGNGVITHNSKAPTDVIVSPAGIISYQIIGDLVLGDIQIPLEDQIRWGNGGAYLFDTQKGVVTILDNKDALVLELERRGVSEKILSRPLR